MSKYRDFDNLLSNKDAAPLLGTTPDALKISRCTGLLFGKPSPKYLKIGYTVRYKESTLKAWIDQFEETKSTQEVINEYCKKRDLQAV